MRLGFLRRIEGYAPKVEGIFVEFLISMSFPERKLEFIFSDNPKDSYVYSLRTFLIGATFSGLNIFFVNFL